MATIKDEAVKLKKNIDAVYEAGKQSEYDRFWDSFQNNGALRNYENKFRQWFDGCYNPKHPIVVGTGKTAFSSCYNQSEITDTRVDITVRSTQSKHCFYNDTKLHTIRKLIVIDTVTFDNWFDHATALNHITIEGEIGNSINFQYCPLTVESMKNIITHLVNYAGTDKDGVYTVKFTTACWTALEADSTAPDGGTWEDHVLNLGWLI